MASTPLGVGVQGFQPEGFAGSLWESVEGCSALGFRALRFMITGIGCKGSAATGCGEGHHCGNTTWDSRIFNGVASFGSTA